MKGFFVNSSVKPNQGWTDFGYLVDRDERPCSTDELEELIENDEAYRMEVFVNYRDGVNIRLRSENRKVCAEVDNRIGFRSRGIETTFYQSTESPRLPSTYNEKTEQNQALTAFAHYALEHGECEGLEAENINWTTLLEDETGL